MPDSNPVWCVRAGRQALNRLRPLLDAHAARREVMVEECPETPRVVMRAGGVVGSVPSDFRLPVFAQAAAAVCRRAGAVGPVALLAQWDERAHRLAEAAAKLAPQALLWPARVITGRDLPQALGIGLGACLYFGHGHPGGWDAYWGIDAACLLQAMTEPMGAVFSLTCGSAYGEPNFSEELVMGGYCAAAYGFTGRHSSHKRNAALGMALAKTMAQHANLASLLAHCGASRLSMAGYSVFGDPLASFAGAEQAAERARQVESTFWQPDVSPSAK